jgi:S1-C subfamily serine protease
MRRLILATAVLAAVAGSAAAQDTARVRPRERTFTFSFDPQDLRVSMRRGRLGILVDLTADAARDSVGARVAGVTPGGPADRAGVQTGDIVIRLNGTRLASSAVGRDEEGAEDQSRPGLNLIRLASRLDGGDTVRLDLRREGRPVQVTFVAEESDMDRIVTRMQLPGLQGLREMMPGLMLAPEGLERTRISVFGGPASDLELVKVNPGLAEYFGTSEGLLVVDVGGDSALGLRAGDVILSIGGRRPTSPSHAMRILGTYEPREAVAFEIMRQKRRQSVSGRIPERGWRLEHNSLEPQALPHIRIEGRKLLRLVSEA